VRGWKAVLVAASTATTAACATAPYGGASAIDAPLAVHAPIGFEVRDAVLLADRKGLRAHGQICPTAVVPRWPRRITLDRLDQKGAPLASVSQGIAALSEHGLACRVYDLPTSWILRPGETLNLSAG
jgi:hypothetical protein